jgi:hypothetical protein
MVAKKTAVTTTKVASGAVVKNKTKRPNKVAHAARKIVQTQRGMSANGATVEVFASFDWTASGGTLRPKDTGRA